MKIIVILPHATRTHSTIAAPNTTLRVSGTKAGAMNQGNRIGGRV